MEAPTVKLANHIPCSDEQTAIVKAICTSNVVVDACAGSGKTTTVLNIAKNIGQTSSILLLTYNTRLRAETIQRATALGLNITVHTYHSFGYKHIGKSCRTDAGIISFIKKDKKLTLCDVTANAVADAPTKKSTSSAAPVPIYTIIIIDEAQDMSKYYYKLVLRIIEIMPTRPLLCVMGDRNQSIYAFNGADPRFITMAEKIYDTSNDAPSAGWSRLDLQTSYRLTKQMAAFINNCTNRGPVKPIIAVKDGIKPQYIYYNDASTIVDEIKRLLKTGYAPGDIFILAPSVKSNNPENPTKKLANCLSGQNILVYVPTSDDAKVDETIISGKLVFSSFHQAKGLERKVVIIVGFDSSYNKFYHKDDPQNISNAMYVAITRAKERLYLYHLRGNSHLECIDCEKLPQYVNIIGKPYRTLDKEDKKPKHISVTKLLSHQKSEVLDYCMQFIKITKIRPAEKSINIPTKCEQKVTKDGVQTVYYEEVSDINGIAIPAWYESQFVREITIIKALREQLRDPAFINRLDYCIDSEDIATSVPAVLRAANIYSSIREGLNYKVDQIHDYSWLSPAQMLKAIERLADTIGVINNTCKLEAPTGANIFRIPICGYIDYLSDKRLIEIKCTNELKPEHYLQLAIYAYCVRYVTDDRNSKVVVSFGPGRQNLLFNVITNELIEIAFSGDDMEKVIRLLICMKYHQCGTLSDAQFLAELGLGCADPELCKECSL